jgi:hypothetical protein
MFDVLHGALSSRNLVGQGYSHHFTAADMVYILEFRLLACFFYECTLSCCTFLFGEVLAIYFRARDLLTDCFVFVQITCCFHELIDIIGFSIYHALQNNSILTYNVIQIIYHCYLKYLCN